MSTMHFSAVRQASTMNDGGSEARAREKWGRLRTASLPSQEPPTVGSPTVSSYSPIPHGVPGVLQAGSLPVARCGSAVMDTLQSLAVHVCVCCYGTLNTATSLSALPLAPILTTARMSATLSPSNAEQRLKYLFGQNYLAHAPSHVASILWVSRGDVVDASANPKTQPSLVSKDGHAGSSRW